MGEIVVRNIYKTFDKLVLDDVSHSFTENKVTVILGPNGAGKTTLMHIMLGLLKFDSGSVIFNGKNLTIPYKKEERVKFMYIPDNPFVNDFLTGYENLEYIASLYKYKGNIDDILKTVDLFDSKDLLVKDYSRGMKQRLCLSCIYMFNPEVLMLDEPTIGLDVFGILDLSKYLRELLLKQNLTIIVSTHDMSFCKQIADEIVILNEGKIFSTSKLNDLLNEYDSIEDALKEVRK